jgi:hypothetical protein
MDMQNDIAQSPLCSEGGKGGYLVTQQRFLSMPVVAVAMDRHK